MRSSRACKAWNARKMGPRQISIGAQSVGEARLAVGRRMLEQRVQLTLEPLRIEVEHRVGEAVFRRRVAVMELARLEQDGLARCAHMLHPSAVKLLHALFGHAHQEAVVPVRIIGMPPEMRADRLDTGVGILIKVDPVASVQGAFRWKLARPVQTLAGRDGDG